MRTSYHIQVIDIRPYKYGFQPYKYQNLSLAKHTRFVEYNWYLLQTNLLNTQNPYLSQIYLQSWHWGHSISVVLHKITKCVYYSMSLYIKSV